MEKRKKPIPGPIIEIGIVVVLALLIWIFVDANILAVFTASTGGDCFSVVFDKAAVKGADRIVIYEGEQVITITDEDAVREIADLFTVANCTDLCDAARYRRLEIYNGDRLVREVRQNDCSELYDIYDQDLFHWVFPSESGIGKVVLSREDAQWLDGIIEQYQQVPSGHAEQQTERTNWNLK